MSHRTQLPDTTGSIGGSLWTAIRSRSGLGYLKEFSWLSASNQVANACSLLTMVVLVRTVPMIEVGQVAFAQSAAAMAFFLIDPRFEDSIQRYVPILRRDDDAAARLFYWRLVRWDIALGLVACAVAGWLWSADLLPRSQVCRPEFLLLAVCTVGLGCAIGTLQAGFAVTDGLSTLARLSVVASVSTATISIVAVITIGATGYLSAAAAGAAAQVALYVVACHRRFAPPRGSALRRPPMPSGLRRFLFSSWLSTSATVGADAGTLMVAGLSGGPELVAILKVAASPGRLLQSLCNPIGTQVFPRLATLAAAHDQVGVRRLTATATQILLVPAIVAMVTGLVLMRPLLGLVYGPLYQTLALVAVLFLLASAIRVLVVWAKVLPLAVGRPGLRVASVSIESAAAIVAVFALPRLFDDLTTASAAIALASVVVAIGVFLFWQAISRRPDLLASG